MSPSAPPFSPADRTVAALERALHADLKTGEREWIDFVNHAQTPLEQHAPRD